MTNKQRALDYLKAAFVDKDLAKVETFLGDHWIQHNPNVPDGLEALRGIIAGNEINWQPSIALEEGDIVAVHGRYTNFFGKTMIGVDFFRFDENGKMTEHWDVLQEEVPADKTASGNAMFPIVPQK
ncbi:nuclear transport factor 2 family protein [Levilactobacillus brevis]|uniref:Nuclear transport factor 2 family protein n=1 Tax=Levilactobacillus hammesii TaxID=267633 RepID=A0A921JVU2_9LACO|nr:nuclear transport factor 2 family protein [Levilactobacillus brevis]HJE86531.1 nuclear transport factor 2 family protein [Levilactobacillus hammesii]